MYFMCRQDVFVFVVRMIEDLWNTLKRFYNVNFTCSAGEGKIATETKRNGANGCQVDNAFS